MEYRNQDENIIIGMDDATGKPTNYYWYKDTHYAEQFPKEWAFFHLPKTGPECEECINSGTWCGVMVGYCRKCAKLYDGERGQGFTSLGTSLGQGPGQGMEWRKIGKPELLEEELRRYYYKQNYNKLYRKMEKADNKLRCKRDALGGVTQMKLAQLEKRREIRQNAIKKQLKKSIDIELHIYAELHANEVERIRTNKKEISLLEKSIKILELSIGGYYSDPTYWNGERLTSLGEEQIHRTTRKMRELRNQKRRIEEVTLPENELRRIEDYIKCLHGGDLLPPATTTIEEEKPCIINSRFSAYNNAIGINETVIEELTHEINTLRRELGQYGGDVYIEVLDDYTEYDDESDL